MLSGFLTRICVNRRTMRDHLPWVVTVAVHIAIALVLLLVGGTVSRRQSSDAEEIFSFECPAPFGLDELPTPFKLGGPLVSGNPGAIQPASQAEEPTTDIADELVANAAIERTISALKPVAPEIIPLRPNSTAKLKAAPRTTQRPKPSATPPAARRTASRPVSKRTAPVTGNLVSTIDGNGRPGGNGGPGGSGSGGSRQGTAGGTGSGAGGTGLTNGKLLGAAKADQPPRELPGNRKPRYPDYEQRYGVTGEVVVRLVIDEQGRVEDVQLVSGREAFWKEVLKVAKTWRFAPARHRGRPVKVWANKPIGFVPPAI